MTWYYCSVIILSMVKDAIEPEQQKEQEESLPAEPVRVVLVGVRLRPGWPVQHFDKGAFDISDGEWVVVSTDHGIEVGQVVGRPVEVTIPEDRCPPKVERLASTYEIEQYYHNLDREKHAWQVCAERIRALGLSMKLVRVESFYNGSKIIFYYSAEERVDFRELVKDLVRTLRCRVEMRQIGVRHEAKMVGGIGNCGRELCCASFLQTFDPISIRMAKAQNLPLNPNKISGLCGRLLCCLTFEYDTYVELTKEMPTLGKPCDTPAGEGKVIRQNILRQTVTVALPGGGEEEFTTEDLIRHREQKGKGETPAKEETTKSKREEIPSKKQPPKTGEEGTRSSKTKQGKRRRSKARGKKKKGRKNKTKAKSKPKNGKPKEDGKKN